MTVFVVVGMVAAVVFDDSGSGDIDGSYLIITYLRET